MVEGIPGPDFAGLKQYSLNIKAWGRLRCRVVPGSLCVYCALIYCPGRIVCGVLSRAYFLCSENVLRRCCRYFFVNSAEKCDLTRGVVLFSDHMWCNCVPVHVVCGF